MAEMAGIDPGSATINAGRGLHYLPTARLACTFTLC